MTSHTTLLKQLKQSTCPECGAPNKCALEQGKSIQACWCFGLDFTEEVVDTECLCKSCLTKKENDHGTTD